MRGLYSLGPHRGQLEALGTGTRFSKVPIVNVLAKSPFLVMWSVSITDFNHVFDESCFVQMVQQFTHVQLRSSYTTSDMELNQRRRRLEREWQHRNWFILAKQQL